MFWYFNKIISYKYNLKQVDQHRLLCNIFNCNSLKTQIPIKYNTLSLNLMHFDGYLELSVNDEILRLAIEYQGYHHFHFPNHYHKNSKNGFKAFQRVQLRDSFKRWLASNSNIFLIKFPYFIDSDLSNPNRIQAYIISKLREKLRLDFDLIPEFNHMNHLI